MEPRTRTKPALTVTPGVNQAIVSVVQWAYRVDYGPGVRPQLHTVSKDRRCQCALAAECPAVSAVGDYLRAGGERAPDPPFDFWPRVPDACPICGEPVTWEPGLNSPEHGLGWRCCQTGLLCYWAARCVPLKAAQPVRQYVIPPVGVADGNPTGNTEVAIQTSLETVRGWVTDLSNENRRSLAGLAPGITAGDMAAAWENARLRQAVWAAEGYFPDS